MGAGKVIAAVVVIVVCIAGGLVLYNALPKTPAAEIDTMIIDWTAWDSLAGSLDAATSAVDIYRLIGGNYVKQESVTMSTASKASSLTYTSQEVLWLKQFDATDTSVCTTYVQLTVPYASAAFVYDGAFQITLPFVDKGDTAKTIGFEEANGTAMADASTIDCSNSGYNTAYATWDFFLKAMDDDSGYTNSYNFLKGYDNNHMVVIDASGTGWDSVTLLSTAGWEVYERASVRYFIYALDNDDMVRDLQSQGTYDPDGRFDLTTTWDLTGITTGDSVTFNYQYMWYSSLANFKATGSWGADTAETEETFTITP